MTDDEILNPVQGDGRYAASLPLFGGLKIWDANPKIVDALSDAGSAAERRDSHDHSYMHCWRHKTPLIYRATSQWFAGMDTDAEGRRLQTACARRALAGIEATTTFFPAWGKARLHGMIANRPDWTLSRQRQWGVPMAFFLHKSDRRAASAHAGAAGTGRRRRSRPAASRPGRRSTRGSCSAPKPPTYEKNNDTLDVWFDSGSTHQTVLRGSHEADSTFPADLYLEGSDQHRGWFHSSLLIARHAERPRRRTRHCSPTASWSTARAAR